MKKRGILNTKLIILAFCVFIFKFNYVNAAKAYNELDLTLSYDPDTKIKDFIDTSNSTYANWYTAPFWVSFSSSNNDELYNDYDSNKYPTNDLTKVNAFCIDPDLHTPAVLKNSINSAKIEASYEYGSGFGSDSNAGNRNIETIRKILYYGLGGPGWNYEYNGVAAHDHWYNAACDGNRYGETPDDSCLKKIYALEHLSLSIRDGSCNVTINTSDGSCNIIKNSDSSSCNSYQGYCNAGDLIDSLDKYPDTPGEFRVYNYNPNEEGQYTDQRIIFFYYHEITEKGYIKVTKNFEGVNWSDTEKDNFCRNNMTFKIGDTSLDYKGSCVWTYGLDSSNHPTLDEGNSYDIKETITNTDLTFTTLNGSSVISNRTISVRVSNVGNEQTEFAGENDVTFTNKLVQYCLKFKKSDSIDKNSTIVSTNKNNTAYSNEIAGNTSNAKNYKVKIQICRDKNNSSTCSEGTTDENGYVTFLNLNYNKWYYKETGGANSQTANYYYNSNSSFSTSQITASEMSGSTCGITDANAVNLSNDHKKWCAKVRKIDALTNTPLSGVSIDLYKKQSDGSLKLIKSKVKTDSNGYATFTGLYDNDTTTYKYIAKVNVDEEKKIYNNSYTWDGNEIEITKLSEYTSGNCSSESSGNLINYPYTIGWYKETENSTKAPSAVFKATDSSGNAIKTKATKENGCYVYDPSGNNTEFASDSEGYTCIKNIPQDSTVTVEEVKPSENHAFNSSNTISVTPFVQKTTATKATKTTANTFINVPTEFEFTKTVTSGDGNQEVTVTLPDGTTKTVTLSELTTNELMQLEFNVTDSNGNVISFIKTAEGTYEYSASIDKPAGTTTTSLSLNSNRKIYIKHLPWGTYTIKEKNSKTCDSNSDYTKCIGYYYPEYSVQSTYTFEINECSNSVSNSTYCENKIKGTVKKSLENTPTEITFTKKDFYHYQDEADVIKEGNTSSNTTAEFENAKERSDFDRIDFKIKDSDGRYLTLQFIGNHGTCLTDDSYSEYRYVYSDQSQGTTGTIMHTCGGHIKITNLCRGKKYTIEEVSVPEDSVYVLENTTSTPTSVDYTINCTGGETKTTQTKVINDKPTRVRFEKRDSKYNYLIPDETTTFRVYQCAKGTTCHPADGVDSTMTLMKFTERAVITGDEEDMEDAEGLSGVEVYKAMSESDIKKGEKYVTDLHPYHGILVLRYLPSGYNYVLLETVAPKNYTLPKGRNAETEFSVTNTTVSVKEVDVANVPTSLLIRKYSEDGNLLTGAKFKIYQKDSCDPNLSAKNQIREELKSGYELKLKTIRDGVYEARPTEDTNIITTCTGSDCSKISTNAETKLTYSSYLGSFADFENIVTKNNEKLNLQEGEALIQYLEYDHCYIIEEVKAPEGYSLPKNEEDRYAMVTIEKNEKYAQDTYKTLINTPTPFTFYKYDEYNNLLDGAEFKLQKLDQDKIYQDVTVTKEEKDGKYYYRADENSDNLVIETINGSATIYYLTEGQYRIVETKAAPGKELTKNPNIATFFVDKDGGVYGNSIIINKAKTEKVSITPSADAEFIIGIRTGQTVVKYGLIIAIISIIISSLMFLNNKKEKKRDKNEEK